MAVGPRLATGKAAGTPGQGDMVGHGQARAQPTPGDAATAVAVSMGQPAKMPVARVSDIQVAGAAGMLPARVYDPQASRGPAPVILYFHGGGWVTGTLDTYDASDRILANGTGAIVLSVAYRLGPENRFPVAQDDADASYAWLLKNAASIGGDPRQIALAGESAGGNMAIDTAIWARDQHLPVPVHELLVYPAVGTDLHTPSYDETTKAVPLNRAAIEWYVSHFTNGPADLKDPRLNVVGAADLHGLPPTTIVSAEIDPLRSEGEALVQKLSRRHARVLRHGRGGRAGQAGRGLRRDAPEGLLRRGSARGGDASPSGDAPSCWLTRRAPSAPHDPSRPATTAGASAMTLAPPVVFSGDIESVRPDEAGTIQELNGTFDTILDTTAKDYGHAVRSVHAKVHGNRARKEPCEHSAAFRAKYNRCSIHEPGGVAD